MAKKRYYGNKDAKMMPKAYDGDKKKYGGAMKSESYGKKMKENKKEGKKMQGMDDESMFGFPSSSKVVEYPKIQYMNQNSGADRDSIRGIDYEMDQAVQGLNNQKNKYRW